MYKFIDIIIAVFIGILCYSIYGMINMYVEKKDEKKNIFKNITD